MALTVTIDEVQFDFDRVREQAREEAICVTENGRELIYLVPPELFRSLKRGLRRSPEVREATQEELAWIRDAEIPEAERYSLADLG